MEINFKSGNSKKSSGGIVGGLIAVVIGIVLLWWNEGRTVKTEGSIAEFESSYIEVDSTKVDEANNGKPIYTHGNLVYDSLGATDASFSVTVDSAVVNRKVEMYQWEEECSEDSDGNESCSHSKVWSEELIDSTEFNQSGYDNPTLKTYDSQKNYASYIRLDAFDMEYFKDDLSTNAKYTELSEEVATTYNFNIIDGYYTSYTSEEEPEIGDYRISFTYNDAKELSVLGAQNDEAIVAYTASNGYNVQKLVEKNETAETLIQYLRNQNNLFKWLCRLGGTLLIIIGLLSIISPIQKLANYIPVLGRVFNTATSAIMAVLGLCISLLVIAIAWFRYRPILSIVLIGVGVGSVVLVSVLKKNKKVDAPMQDAFANNTKQNTPMQDATTNQTETQNTNQDNNQNNTANNN